MTDFFSRHRRRATTVILGAAISAAVLLVAFFIARYAADRLVESRTERLLAEEHSVAVRLARGAVHTVNQDLMLIRGIPRMLAQVRPLQDAAHAFDARPYANLPPEQRRERLRMLDAMTPVNELLRSAQIYFGADLVWLATPSGLIIATSDDLGPGSVLGENYGDRTYFQSAVLGTPDTQYLIGRKSRQPGVFFSAPVYDNGVLVGVTVVKLGLRRLSHWVDTGASFVTDANGVVVLAGDPQLTGMAVPGARVFSMPPAERKRLYQQEDFAVMPLEDYDPTPGTPIFLHPTQRDARLVRLHHGDEAYLLEAMPSMDGELVVYMVNDVPTLRSLVIERQRYMWLMFGLLVSSAGALIMLVRYLRRGREQLTDTLARNAVLEHEVKYDALTGALSRGHFLKRLRAEITLAGSTQIPMSVILVDLDHFKQFNDTWGHALGDNVLATFVRVCHDSLREDDSCGRLGGEEFAIILSGANETRAFDAAERLREAVGETQITVGSNTLRFTISAGVAAWHPGDDDSAWLQRADAALYLAKSRGRNRCARESDLQALTRQQNSA